MTAPIDAAGYMDLRASPQKVATRTLVASRWHAAALAVRLPGRHGLRLPDWRTVLAGLPRMAVFVSLAARLLECAESRTLGRCIRVLPDPRDPEIDRLRMELVAAGRRLGAEEREHVEEDDRADAEIERLRSWLELISDDCVQVGHTEGGRFVPHDHSASFARRALSGERSPLQDGEDDV